MAHSTGARSCSDSGDLLDPTLLGGHGHFPHYVECLAFQLCEGHADSSSRHLHGTAWDHFGEMGVVLTKIGDKPPVVSLIDMDPAQNDYTPAEARMLALQILLAADLAERFAQPSPAEPVIRQLALALATT